ncbi:hypothetical protein Bcep18194_C7731 [Burkholderia lata]|uniref:Uncharacterized protein n=1 Tax=Burkholderia lata (strain ATCC 17760 / DSM 23089 / LMG 22485 / NCIMB 9086 / R18194 / 383) TaxID=482957 RepID=Q39L91_BURL3|nr:hypothetical protein Bcep18194_C7731 [Burkholderia lata]
MAGKRDVGGSPRARRNGPRYAADDIDSAILRTFRPLRAPRDRCGRNESGAGTDVMEWARHLRRSIDVIVDVHAAGAAVRNAESQRGPRRTDAAGSHSTSRGGIPRARCRASIRAAGAIAARKMAPISVVEDERRDIRKRIHIMRNTTAWTHFRYPESGQCRPVSQPAAARTGILPLLPCPASWPGARKQSGVRDAAP